MTNQRNWLSGALCIGVLALTSSTVCAQDHHPPRIHGFSGTMALPESVDAFYKGLGSGIEKTSDGVRRMKGTPDAKLPAADPFTMLAPGTPVIVHFTVKGIQAARPDEATVIAVDRSSRRIAVQFAGGTVRTLRATHESDQDSSRAIVYRAGEPGQPAAGYFKTTRRSLDN